MAARIVGENSMGMRLACRSFQAHRALSTCDFEILRRGFSSVLDFLEFDRLTLIQSAQTRALDG
jgi:hypothetical protein